MAAEFYIEDTSENEKPACVQSGLGEVALSPGSTYIDQEVRRMEIDEIIARLVQRGVLDSNSASLERAGTVLEWADNAMSEFAEFKSVLGDNVPTGLASYMRENSMSAEEYGSTYSEEVNRHVKAFTVSCLNEMMPRIKTQCSELYERLRAEGVHEVNANWQVEQLKIHLLACLEKDVIGPQRLRIRQEVSAYLPAFEQLPSTFYRYAQLDAFYSISEAYSQSGDSMQLTPLPYKEILRTILPSFNPNDTTPKKLPNSGRDIDTLYIDPAYTQLLRGADGVMQIPYQRTKYAQIHSRSERFGDFGLALWPSRALHNQEHEVDSSQTHCYEDYTTSKADISAGIIWALLYIADVRRGSKVIDDDIKVVLPDAISGARHEFSALQMSLYRSNKGSMQPSRFGLAFDIIPGQASSGSLPSLECIQWRAA